MMTSQLAAVQLGRSVDNSEIADSRFGSKTGQTLSCSSERQII